MNKTEFVYLMDNFNPVTRTADFYVKDKYPINSEFKKFRVTVSPLLANRIEYDRNARLLTGDSYLGTEFTSPMFGGEYHDNPFRLVDFVPSSSSDIPRNMLVKAVDEPMGKSEVLQFVHVTGTKYEQFAKQRFLKSRDFIRHLTCTIDKKFSECAKAFSFVPIE